MQLIIPQMFKKVKTPFYLFSITFSGFFYHFFRAGKKVKVRVQRRREPAVGADKLCSASRTTGFTDLLLLSPRKRPVFCGKNGLPHAVYVEDVVVPPSSHQSVWKNCPLGLSTLSYVCAPKKSLCACRRFAGSVAQRYES